MFLYDNTIKRISNNSPMKLSLSSCYGVNVVSCSQSGFMDNNMAITKTSQWRTIPLHILSSNPDHIPNDPSPLAKLVRPRENASLTTYRSHKFGMGKRKLTRRCFEESGAGWSRSWRHRSSHPRTLSGKTAPCGLSFLSPSPLSKDQPPQVLRRLV